jgi:sugar-specific transcriptional regulator TrmB
MEEDDAVETLTRLGLTTYEARVFVALQKTGPATASEVSDVADVPRSQVYGAAEGLEERGLVDVGGSTPTRYRPVELSAARRRLVEELERAGDAAFEYLEGVQGALAGGGGDRTEAVWTVEGKAAVAARTAELVAAAEERVLYGTGDAERVEPEVAAALSAAAEEGVLVVGVSAEDDAHERFASVDGVDARRVPRSVAPDVGTGRVLLRDADGVLLSAVGGEYLPASAEETAIWSADTALAGVLGTLVEAWVGANVGPDAVGGHPDA